jgi:hypothetical protein
MRGRNEVLRMGPVVFLGVGVVLKHRKGVEQGRRRVDGVFVVFKL